MRPIHRVTSAVETAEELLEARRPAFDPLPPGKEAPRVERWWGRHHLEFRWQLEAARLLADPVYRGIGVPHGDGRAVVLLPGFLAGDWSLRVMSDWLDRLGYVPRTCGFWFNVGCSDDALRSVECVAEDARQETGRRVALIGHSRGGHFAKALAVQRPSLVSHAISMGAALASPFDISIPTRAAVQLVGAYRRRTGDRIARRGCLTETCSCSFAEAFAQPAPPSVRLFSLHSKGDGVVRWQSCVVPDATNLEITGSHVGMAFNRGAYRAIAEALAQPEPVAPALGAVA